MIALTMPGRQLRPLTMTEKERAELERWARRPKSSQSLAQRAKIVLRCADGHSNNEVAEGVGVSSLTVGKWRERFRRDRLQGLSDAPRCGPPRKIGDDIVEDVVTRTLTSRPKGATHWSTREMAAQTGLSQSAIVRIWRTFGLQPHRTESFKLSTDPLFIEKTRDVIGLYMSPPENAIVFCVDEKSQVQALDRTQPIFPMRPGVPERQTHDYQRHGVTSLFAALNVKTGEVIGACHRRHRHQEFLRFLHRIDNETPAELDIHLVVDNYGTHKAGRETLAREASALYRSLYADECKLAQPGRALLRGDHATADPTWDAHEYPQS
jgi:transposase